MTLSIFINLSYLIKKSVTLRVIFLSFPHIVRVEPMQPLMASQRLTDMPSTFSAYMMMACEWTSTDNVGGWAFRNRFLFRSRPHVYIRTISNAHTYHILQSHLKYAYAVNIYKSKDVKRGLGKAQTSTSTRPWMMHWLAPTSGLHTALAVLMSAFLALLALQQPQVTNIAASLCRNVRHLRHRRVNKATSTSMKLS